MNRQTASVDQSRVGPICLRLVGVSLGLSILCQSVPGMAQKKPRVVTISEVTIVGRVQKPIAAVDVSKIPPKLTLGEMKQPFVERIEKAIQRSPF